jgi:hypothetical protein
MKLGSKADFRMDKSLFLEFFLKVIYGKSDCFFCLEEFSRESEFFKIFGKVLAIVVDPELSEKFLFVFGNFDILHCRKFFYGFYGKGTVKMEMEIDKAGCFHEFYPP